MSALRVVRSRSYDLPPSWDGRRVEWGQWEAMVVFSCPGGRVTCDCGSADLLTTTGVIHPNDGDTVDVPIVKRTKSGREYESGTRQVPAKPELRLSAQRCVTCGQDIVTDRRDGSVWILDESDYSQDGS